MDAVERIFGKGLPHRLGIIVPGTTKVNQALSPTEHQHWARLTARRMAETFGGANALPPGGWGGWFTDDGDYIGEPTILVYSNVEDLSDGNLLALKELAGWLKQELKQHSIAIEIDGGVHFV